MRINQFRVRDRIHPKLYTEHQTQNQSNQPKQTNILKNDQLKLSSLLQSFQNIITHLVNSNNNNKTTSIKEKNLSSHFSKEIEYRDRFVVIDLPDFSDDKVDLEKLEPWVGQVCEQSLSVAFHYFVEKKMNYDQMKAFASESLLRNIVVLAQSCHLSADVIRFIDDTMNDKILPFLKAKYPLAVERQVNKALQGAVKSIDNSQAVTNDYFFTSDIRFEYRQSGRYDDLIMTLLNEIMTRVDNPSQSTSSSGLSNFKEFESMMTQIFQKSFDEDWMESNNTQLQAKSVKDQKEKQKYENKVKEYTSYLIGRKISQNTQMYTEEQIKSQHLTIKSPTILRILTKWCDELWAKFENENYFNQRTEGLLLVKSKKVGLVFPWIKKNLKNFMMLQKQKILKFMKEIQEINYKQQVDLLQNQIENTDCLYLDKIQRSSGKFACKIVNNAQSFIVYYLNRLIHGLANVSKDCYFQMEHFKEYWPSAYNLISFNVSDIMRCKYASKQKEVLKIFKQIQRITTENSQKFKIIKVKNRLKNATNDIMIIAKFNNKINCQIQIAVNNTNSEFMNCSNKINHYIYELERSIFGPILQMCSIWKSCEKRSELFNKLIENQNPRKHRNQIQLSQCVKNNKSHHLTEEKNPFVCTECSKHYYHNNFIVNHFKCNACQYWKCARCLITQNFQKESKDFFFQDDQLKNEYQFWKKKNQIPDHGACIFINRPTIEVSLYKKMTYNFKDYLVHRKNDQVSILKQVTTLKDIKKFLYDSIVFQLPKRTVCQELKFNTSDFESKIISNLFIPEYILSCLHHEKEAISVLRQDHFPFVNFDKIYSEGQHKLKRIESIEFSSTNLQKLDFMTAEFINLKRLNLNLNRIANFEKVCQFKKLQKLYINQNQITEIPSQIGDLKELKQLYLYGNQIDKFPQSFSLLNKLTVLSLNQNSFEEIPQSFIELQNLRELEMKNNALKKVPGCLFKLKNLSILNLESNAIEQVSDQADELLNLKYLNLGTNLIKKLPQRMDKFPNLQKLQLSNNAIERLPESFCGLRNLKQVNFLSNSLTQISDDFGNLQKISHLNFGSNKIQKLNPCIFKLSQMIELDISNNGIFQLQDSFDKFPKLRQLCICDNKLREIPKSTTKVKTLTTIIYHGNPLQVMDVSLLVGEGEKTYIDISNQQQLKEITCLKLLRGKEKVKEITINRTGLEIFPEWLFGDYGHAEVVNFDNNSLKEVSDNVKSDCAVKSFSLKYNLVIGLPQTFGRMMLLESLFLQNNQIEQFPLVICELPNLKALALDHNKLTSIPNAIAELKNLQTLQATNNQLQSIPQTIGQLTNLRTLLLTKNQIKSIPLGLCSLTQLKQLALYSNCIEVIPKEISQMGELDLLGIRNNPIREFGDEVFLAEKCEDWEQLKEKLKLGALNQNANKQEHQGPVNTQNQQISQAYQS